MPREAYYFPPRNLVANNDSELIERANIPRSKFIGSWARKTAFSAGFLTPFLIDEILPGDHMSYDVDSYIRMVTPLFPIFDNQRFETFFFFVPNRLIWANWKKMMGEQANPSDSIAFTIPQIAPLAATDITPDSIYDHMGLPNQITAGQTISVNALPFRAYNRIWNEWFRDENIQNSIGFLTDNGPDPIATYLMQRRGKIHDYFTSCLPWPQKFTAPVINLGTQAPISGLGIDINTAGAGGNYWDTAGAATIQAYGQAGSWNSAAEDPAGSKFAIRQKLLGGNWLPDVYADLSSASVITINALRQAFMTQSLLERDARGGTRYIEMIKSHFGVTSPDARQQRTEYLGGGSSNLQTTPIAQTAPTTGKTVGALGAATTSVGRHHASYAATEHGYIIGLMQVRTELSYQQGLHKMWTRQTRFDFFYPVLSQLGEQAVLRQEIYATGVDADDTTVFGYQERWHEYRTRYNEITGYMRSTYTGTLDAWHLAQNFGTPPTLSNEFIQDNPPMSRILAAGSLADNQQFLGDILIHRTAVRPMPTYGTPANLGRF